MEKPNSQDYSISVEGYKKTIFVPPKTLKPSSAGMMIEDFFVKTEYWTALNYVNILAIYILTLVIISGVKLSYWYAMFYPLLLLIVRSLRNNWVEKERRANAHRIPFFADALANSLSVGSTLEQACSQSIYYLRGRLKIEFQKVMVKNSYGKELGKLLRELEVKFPNTGLKYLISLLEEYRDMGIGISPLLKKMADALKVKEEAEEKIQTILAGGSSYARISMVVFGIVFAVLAFLLKDQIPALLTPELKPVFMMLAAWATLGIFIVTRVTTIGFVNHFALRPYVSKFMGGKQWTTPNLLSYSGLHNSFYRWMKIALYAPLLIGFFMTYVFSWYTHDFILIEITFFLGVLLARLGMEFYFKGLVEDQLIKTVEVFPEFLQVYIIGLNSGLNPFMALKFACTAIEGTAPELMRREIMRVKSALECGEDHTKVWQRLSDYLPFEIIVDFCEIMIISPLHGESIVKSLDQLMMSFQAKKLGLVEKKAIKLGQLVIPIIVIAFFPLFLFVVFGPLWVKISALFN